MGPVMALSGSYDGRLVLGEVTVRPVRGVAEQRRWDALVAHHHYLAFHGLFGRALRHVAVHGEMWIALLGWTAGAFKVVARDAWIGWSPEQQFARLHLIANNSRFVMLTDRGRVPNLASRVLALSLRRVAHDMRARHGFPVVLAETFVDPSRFSGTCYRASNWRRLGLTRGFSRVPGGSARWRENGQPKEVYVYALEAQAREALCATEEPPEWQLGAKDEPIPAEDLRSLHAFLEVLPDFRGSVRNSVFGPPLPDPVGPTVPGHCSSLARVCRPQSTGTGRSSPPQWGTERFPRAVHGRGPRHRPSAGGQAVEIAGHDSSTTNRSPKRIASSGRTWCQNSGGARHFRCTPRSAK